MWWIQGKDFDGWAVRLQPVDHFTSAFFRRSMTNHEQVVFLGGRKENFGRFVTQHRDDAVAAASEQCGGAKACFFLVSNLENTPDRSPCMGNIRLRDNLVRSCVLDD